MADGCLMPPNIFKLLSSFHGHHQGQGHSLPRACLNMQYTYVPGKWALWRHMWLTKVVTIMLESSGLIVLSYQIVTAA